MLSSKVALCLLAIFEIYIIWNYWGSGDTMKLTLAWCILIGTIALLASVLVYSKKVQGE